MSRTVAYVCPYVPAELVLACGLTPRKVVCGAHAAALPPAEGLCPYVRTFCGGILADPPAAAIFTTLCDQMRRGWELLYGDLAGAARHAQHGKAAPPTFLLNVPKTTSPAAGQFFRSELERLLEFLSQAAGRRPSNAEIAAACRQGIAKGTGCAARTNHQDGIPLALVGGPLMAEDADLRDMLARCDGTIALDATDSGELVLPGPMDPAALAANPLAELARVYFAIPHPARRPDEAFHRRLREEISARGIRGIIFRRYVWCDTWHAQLGYLREQLGLPVLDLDVGDQPGESARARTRLEAFLEVLRG